MRARSLFALLAVFSMAMPGSSFGQATSDQSPVDVTVFAGVGSGPSPSAAWGLNAEVPLHDLLALTAEFSQWDSGLGVACSQSWPESYECSVGGWAVLGGLNVRPGRIGRVEPFGEILGGRYSREQQGTAHRSTTLGLGLGADIRLFSNLSLRAGGRYMRPFDDAYAELMGEDLSYTMGTVGLQYSFTW